MDEPVQSPDNLGSDPILRRDRSTSGPPGRSSSSVYRLLNATDQFNRSLKYLAETCKVPSHDGESLLRELTHYVRAVQEACKAVEKQFAGDLETIRYWQGEFRRRTQAMFAQSYFMNRARTWPRGYPGDHEIIERAYDNRSISTGIGELLDRYFLNATLAHGIRARREKMREVLADELESRPGAHVLNVGCGPCREVVELAPVILRTRAHFVCLDFDVEALDYSSRQVEAAGLGAHVEMQQYNALRLVSLKKNIAQFGRQDIIYSIGLLDYLTDDVLIRLIGGLHGLLNPRGVFVAVFKDSCQYDTADYHWLVDWTGFLQRTARESQGLMAKAGVADHQLPVERSSDDVMLFYRLMSDSSQSDRATFRETHSGSGTKNGSVARPAHNRRFRVETHRQKDVRG